MAKETFQPRRATAHETVYYAKDTGDPKSNGWVIFAGGRFIGYGNMPIPELKAFGSLDELTPDYSSNKDDFGNVVIGNSNTGNTFTFLMHNENPNASTFVDYWVDTVRLTKEKAEFEDFHRLYLKGYRMIEKSYSNVVKTAARLRRIHYDELDSFRLMIATGDMSYALDQVASRVTPDMKTVGKSIGPWVYSSDSETAPPPAPVGIVYRSNQFFTSAVRLLFRDDYDMIRDGLIASAESDLGAIITPSLVRDAVTQVMYALGPSVYSLDSARSPITYTANSDILVSDSISVLGYLTGLPESTVEPLVAAAASIGPGNDFHTVFSLLYQAIADDGGNTILPAMGLE